GQQVDLRAHKQIADVVAGPRLVDVRIARDDAADRRVVEEKWTGVAVDARVEDERSEDLRAVCDADTDRAGKIADVRVALDVVRCGAVAANRPFPAWEDFGGRNKPQPSVAVERRRCRACLVRRRGRRGRLRLSGGCTLPRGWS